MFAELLPPKSIKKVFRIKSTLGRLPKREIREREREPRVTLIQLMVAGGSWVPVEFASFCGVSHH